MNSKQAASWWKKKLKKTCSSSRQLWLQTFVREKYIPAYCVKLKQWQLHFFQSEAERNFAEYDYAGIETYKYYSQH